MWHLVYYNITLDKWLKIINSNMTMMKLDNTKMITLWWLQISRWWTPQRRWLSTHSSAQLTRSTIIKWSKFVVFVGVVVLLICWNQILISWAKSQKSKTFLFQFQKNRKWESEMVNKKWLARSTIIRRSIRVVFCFSCNLQSPFINPSMENSSQISIEKWIPNHKENITNEIWYCQSYMINQKSLTSI